MPLLPIDRPSLRHSLCLLAAAAVVLAVAGCDAQHRAMEASEVASAPASGAPAVAKRAADSSSGGAAAAHSEQPKVAAPVSRRIIYSTEIELVAENLSNVERELRRLVKASGGYVAETNVGGEPGAPRHGEWKVRVPVDQFDAFVSSVVQLGELKRIHTDSQDVTEEYYDTDARLRSKRVEEQRLLHHMEASTGRLQDILAVERELSRVREEIEQLQGHLQKLGSLSALATVTLQLDEVREYVPPKATGFGDQVGRTFHESVAALRGAGEAAVLFFVALLPWLLALAIVAVPVILVVRRGRVRRDDPPLL